ncbi:type VI secretion system baseplate subunit TssF, partial [Pantoea agglomerans]|uniref:type VI secretion system baseplate subunit TssF n=1 Tax=Enterobacter agglomerans TaxID=549 RepID=UPI001F5D2FAA
PASYPDPRGSLALRQALVAYLAVARGLRCQADQIIITSGYEGLSAWRLISHLQMNYLSLMDSSDEEGAAALRQLLSLYAN